MNKLGAYMVMGKFHAIPLTVVNNSLQVLMLGIRALAHRSPQLPALFIHGIGMLRSMQQ